MFVEAPSPYYRIRLDPPPKTLWLRSLRHENYRYRFDTIRPHVVEINYLQEGNLCELRRDGEVCYGQGTVRTLVENRQFTQYSTAPFTHEIYLYVRLSEPALPMTAEDVRSWICSGREAILPEVVTSPSLCKRIGSIFKSYQHYASEPLGQLKLRLCLQEVLLLLTQHAMDQVRAQSEAEAQPKSLHTQLACQYIQARLSEKLTVTDIADAANISYSHLKNLFRRDMGMSILQYINQQRIQSVKSLLSDPSITLAEAGSIVGIPDPAYLSRLFQKYTGTSATEYRKQL